MPKNRRGAQAPTKLVIRPYRKSRGDEAIALYNATGRKAQVWQARLIRHILAINKKGLWVHTKFGYSVPRRNGKNEVVAMRELWGITQGEHILHTAHRTTTSHAAWERLVKLLDAAGYEEVVRPKKDEVYGRHYKAYKAMGLENVVLLDGSGGSVSFRTRSAKGGLGEGFDLLVIDEAQEYQDDQESALKYVVTDSNNPQTIMCGTPPTPQSSGTIFTKYRDTVLAGEGGKNNGWAEWSVEFETDPEDREAWYLTNPSLGTVFTERSISDEIGTDKLDFNIQRLGLWIKYNLKSAISEREWNALKCDVMPELSGRLVIGIKYAHDGSTVSVAIGVKTTDERVFVEAVDCRPTRAGTGWIIDFLRQTQANTRKAIIDGASGQRILEQDMKSAKLKAPYLPTVKDIIQSNAALEPAIAAKTICHAGQPALTQAATNCEHRAIGSNGGYGYRAIKDGVDISLLDSVILAAWGVNEFKDAPVKQNISY